MKSIKSVLCALLLCVAILPRQLHALSSVDELNAEALTKNGSIRIRVKEAGDQTSFTIALRSKEGYWLGSLSLMDEKGLVLAKVEQMRGEDIRRGVLREVLHIYGWEQFYPAHVFHFRVPSKILKHSKFEWIPGPAMTDQGYDFGSSTTFWSSLQALSDAAEKTINTNKSILPLTYSKTIPPKTAKPHNDPFPVIPPITEADPFKRHTVSVRVPGLSKATRNGNSLTIDLLSLQTTNLMVGHEMVTGIISEDKIYQNGKEHLLSTKIQSGLIIETNETVTLGPNEISQKGQEFTFEHRVTIFETDLPPQHDWSPQEGKHFRVLWERAFKETIY
ncbi:MAG: hypothetical protein M3Y82_14860 [Verrucomicrobiota bacterium]|nr:hypothetical protein [Verrucomicrobiota bacterium]